MKSRAGISCCTIVEAPEAQSPVLQSMLASHLVELGAPTDYPYLPLYWHEAERIPFFILNGAEIIGFALVRKTSPKETFEIAEFYIRPESRRMGFGSFAVKCLLSSFSGTWHLSVSHENESALQFWRAVLPEAATEALTQEPRRHVFHLSTLAYPHVG